MRPGKRDQGRTALELMEESVHLLRMSPFTSLGIYYIGTLPFVLALLYFWTDMSRGAFAAGRLIPSSLTLALLFIWMKSWQTVFAQSIKDQIFLSPGEDFSILKFFRLAETQGLIQATGLVIMPLSLLFGLTAWCLAFYQNASILDNGQGDLKKLLNRSWTQARFRPGQNHALLLIVSFLGIFVFLNIAACLYLLPQLLNKVLGLETLFTMGGRWSVLNTTFLAVTLSLTFLCLDPFLKTAYILRCFYGQSLSSGEDLKADIKRLRSYKVMIPALILLVGLATMLWPEPISAGPEQPPVRYERRPISSNKLNTSIDRVLNRREFTWRLPRENPDQVRPAKDNLVLRLIKWTAGTIKNVFNKAREWIGKFWDWLKNLFPEKPLQKSSPDGNWMPFRRALLYVLPAVLSALMAFVLWKALKRHQAEPITTTGTPVFARPDLANDRTRADDLPADRWLMLAGELMEQGDLRLALRAFYLATLAHLADQGLITIQGYKSNREYETELHRRAHEYRTLLSLFSINVRLFDRSWYGRHKVTPAVLDSFIDNQERIMAFGQE